MQKLCAKSFQHKRDCHDSLRLCRPFGRLYGYSQKRRVRHFVFGGKNIKNTSDSAENCKHKLADSWFSSVGLKVEKNRAAEPEEQWSLYRFLSSGKSCWDHLSAHVRSEWRRDVRSRWKGIIRNYWLTATSGVWHSWRHKAAAGFSPQSGSPGGGLTATYCTPNAKAFPIDSRHRCSAKSLSWIYCPQQPAGDNRFTIPIWLHYRL